MGIMNEPHDLDINTWRDTVQEVVTAIRNAGATVQWILLPGTGYTSAGNFQYTSDVLSTVTNPDGSIDNLIFDVHRYYNAQGSDTYSDCATDYLDQFGYFTNWLRAQNNGNGRMALITETGGLNSANCVQYVCSALDYMNRIVMFMRAGLAGELETCRLVMRSTNRPIATTRTRGLCRSVSPGNSNERGSEMRLHA